jgi:hypothetical protein
MDNPIMVCGNDWAMPVWIKETPAFTPGPQFVVGNKEYSQNFINPLNKAYGLL